MANNIEKFGTPKSMKDLVLEEGLADYEEEKIEAATEETRKKTQKALEQRELERAEEKELWQKRVDDLFQSGNFDEIKILLRARPELRPNPEIVRMRLNELITSRPSNWERIFSDIQSISDVRPDPAVVEQEFSALFAQFGNEKNILDQMKALKKTTGFSPSQEQIQGKYRAILKGQKSYSFDTEDLIKDVKSLTGIQPDKAIFQEVLDRGDILQAKKLAPIFGAEITSEMVQQAYEAQFVKNGYIDTYRISEIGEKPNPELVHRVYQRIIEKRGDRWIDSVKSLEQSTGVKPAFTEEQMRPIFEEFLQRGWYGQSGYVGIDHLVQMTGMKPPVDLVEKTALKVIDGGHGYIDQGKGIKKGLDRLRKSVGVEFEIPESEIQARYQKAMTDKKPHVIDNLYGALGVRPKIDKEEARQFMVALMDETYHNPIPELEKVFGVKFKATAEEIEAKQNEDLEKSRFDNLAKITELTGKECDKQKIEAALVSLLQKEATTPPHTRGSYGYDWQKSIKQRLEQFGVAIPEEATRSIYETLVANEIIFSSNVVKVQEVTGTSLPADLAQRAYERILSPDYVTSVSTGQGSSYGYGLSSTFAEIYKASGVRPELPSERVQQFYRSRLERADFYEIKKIVEVTEIQPSFDQGDVNKLYKQWILDGKEGYIRSAKEITGIELQLDEETIALVSGQIEAGIEKVRSGNYEKTKSYSDEKEFDSYSLEQDLRKVGSLTSATGIRPNVERLQSAYSEILSSDPYWSTKIEQIVKATGIKPEIPAEIIQARGQQLLEQGALRGFQRLQEYGQFTFTPEIAERAYAGLLASSQKYDEYDRRNYYNEDWLERIKRFKELSGVPPSESQLGEIFGHLVKDGGVARRSYNRMSDIVEIFQKDLGTNVSESIARDVYRELFVAGNFKEIEEFKKKTGIVPEVSTEIVGEKCNDLLQKREFQTLKSIKAMLGLETLPLSPEIVQAEYTKLVENPKFATYSDKDIETFYALFELTGVRPELSSEQMAMGYRRVMFASYDGSYEKFERVVGVPPTESDFQNRIYNYLIQDYLREDAVSKFVEKYDLSVAPEIATKAALKRLEKTELNRFKDFLKSVELIAKISKVSIHFEAQNIEPQLDRMLRNHKMTEHSCTELDDLFTWFEESTGQSPSQELIDIAYSQTLAQSVSYDDKHKTPDGKYLEAWDWLKQKYGLPSAEAVQGTYYAQINQENLRWKLIGHLEYIQSFSRISPNIDEMVRALRAQGVERGEIEQKLQSIYQAGLLDGRTDNIEQLAKQWDIPFSVSEAEAQIIYAKILFGDEKLQEQQYKFMAEHSGYLPDEELVENKYRELLLKELQDSGSVDINKVFDVWDLTGIEPPKELVAEADNEWSQSHIHLIRYVQLLGSQDFENLFPKTYTKIVEQMGEKLAEDVDLADYFFENLHTYYTKPWTADYLAKAVQHYSVAKKFKDALEQGGTVWSSQPWTEVVSQQAQVAIDQGPPHDEWGDEDEYYGGAESESFLQEDPFENHPLRKIRSSLGLGRIMAEKITPAEAELELSVEAVEALREINGILTKEHDSFLERFGKNSAVPEEDRIALTDQSQSKVKMNNLLPNVRNFVGRYLAQLANGDPEKLSEIIISQKDSIKRMVQEGYRRYLKIYEVDIPLYDKLYEEFDHWREAGRYPMEVYLGRDGIYAYIGRRAQDATRRSKVGRKKREQLRSEGEVIEINPKYLVYPRYFRDNINYDTKRAFLEQEQISPEMDPLFYDTGYTGTIPEQIMRVMDFDQADIEERIRLLSAPSAKRRVKGIPENARSEIIEYIEHNAKTENTAEGLLQDEKTGKIRHVARPTDPEEQFYFMMIKQAITRHYMVQERLHFEAPENANYDSEDYYIRVRQEYADILPADFIKNPKQYFEQQGTLLKGSKGEGEYPDEEVLSFKLEDGTEVIAKRVELRKSKEARKEFMILIASKKAGLPTAEPVGFLSGKKEEDGSYLLMEKLEGYSGRKFEKYLQESGKFTDEQITGIMKTVADKLKDLAQVFRDQLNIDKRWRIKDTIIQFNEETGEVEDVIPIDWERVKTYDPNKPQKIDLVE